MTQNRDHLGAGKAFWAALEGDKQCQGEHSFFLLIFHWFTICTDFSSITYKTLTNKKYNFVSVYLSLTLWGKLYFQKKIRRAALVLQCQAYLG